MKSLGNLISKKSRDIIFLYYWINNFDEIEILWNNENLVIKLWSFVIRFSRFSHRTYNEIFEETNLLNLLAINWADSVKLIKSINNNYFEVNDYDKIYITVFEYIKWKIINLFDQINIDKIVKYWWKTMWKIHKIISDNYSNLNYLNRLEWDQEVIIKDADKLLNVKDNYILEILKRLKNSVSKLNKDVDNYGFIHTDMRPRNFHYDNWKITHFDFDDISSNWFVYDIAVAVFHETEVYNNIEERTLYLLNFLKNFIDWYLIEKEIKYEILSKLIDFMHIRLIYAYIDYYKRLKIKLVDSWKEKMLIRKVYIWNMKDFIDIDKINNFISSYKWLCKK